MGETSKIARIGLALATAGTSEIAYRTVGDRLMNKVTRGLSLVYSAGLSEAAQAMDRSKSSAAVEQGKAEEAQARVNALAASRAYQKKATLSPIRTNPVVASQSGPALGTSSYSTSRKLLGG